MEEKSKCPVCVLRERLTAGAEWLRQRRPLKPMPLHCQLTATLPLPNKRQLHGSLSGVFFVAGRLYTIKSFARTRRAAAGARPLELRLELSAEPRQGGDDRAR